MLGKLDTLHQQAIISVANHDPGQIRADTSGSLGLDGLRRALSNAIYLQDESVTLNTHQGKVVVWGSPLAAKVEDALAADKVALLRRRVEEAAW